MDRDIKVPKKSHFFEYERNALKKSKSKIVKFESLSNKDNKILIHIGIYVLIKNKNYCIYKT